MPIAQHPADQKRSVCVRADEATRNTRFLHPSQRRLKRGQPTLASADGFPARPSLTRFSVLARGADGALATACLARPVTGRMHQIRVHAEHLGHPLAGDSQVGPARAHARIADTLPSHCRRAAATLPPRCRLCF